MPISFNQVHEPSGKRIQYEKVVEGIGPVDQDEIIKGYEISKGKCQSAWNRGP